jgi:hypothetical protein
MAAGAARHSGPASRQGAVATWAAPRHISAMAPGAVSGNQGSGGSGGGGFGTTSCSSS